MYDNLKSLGITIFATLRYEKSGVAPAFCYIRLIDGAQQFVDAHFTAGFRVHFLHDNRTVQAVLTIFRRQVAGNNHGACRNTGLSNLYGRLHRSEHPYL